MSRTNNGSLSETSRSIGALVDEACDLFEAAWQRGERPRIEDFLVRVAPSRRQSLLVELLALDISYRRKNHEQPLQHEYLVRFAGSEPWIQSVFDRCDATGTVDATTPATSTVRQGGASVTMSTRYSQLVFHDEGGLGEVFAAHDEELGREVAIKFIRHRHAQDDDMASRFHIEAEVTGRLDHPGVVPVYGIGESWDGRPCYAMRFIEGVNLRTAIQDFYDNSANTSERSTWRLEMHRLLGHLLTACDTVAYAHNRGVLHRDIKPENIMLGRYGETLVVDWGLAQFIERDAQAKASGEQTLLPGMIDNGDDALANRGGTIGYLAPEQLPGSSETVTKACDIYSLGATLYKLLTGHTAFHASQGYEVWNHIRCGDFRSPREVNKRCPAALEAICLKAMALRPQDRYATATDFGQDLRRWMADEPVDVYDEPLLERMTRVARRHRAWSFAVAACLTLLLVGLLAGTFFSIRHARREYELRTAAENAERVAERARLANLRSVAAFAADTYGYEIDQRWRILSEIAAETELQTLIKHAAATEADSTESARLQNWLVVQSSEFLAEGKADSWFVNDASGVQLARNPWKDTIGRSFRHRTYFHGGPRDAPLDDTASLTPITQPHLSAVYESTATHELKVSFTVPIWDHESPDAAQPIGVLGMSVKLGDFVQLESELEEMSVVLVDLRTDWLEEDARRGLILDHPNLDEARLALAADTGRSLLRLPEQQIAKLEELRTETRQRRRWKGTLGNAQPRVDCVSRDFADPTLPHPQQHCVASFEPVFVPGREEAMADTGWVVIIEDHANGSISSSP
jgi:serine/threonine-protein kinase